MLIYKILRAPECAAFVAAGRTDGAPVDLKDGFIHFSTAAQLAETARRHFVGEAGLWLLACESKALGPALQWEASRGGENFPHLYRALISGDVVCMRALPSGPDGPMIGALE